MQRRSSVRSGGCGILCRNTMSRTNLVTVALVLAVALPYIIDQTCAMSETCKKCYSEGDPEWTSAMFIPCKKCLTEVECNSEPMQYCPYGEHRNMCNRRVCSKGPGEKCGDNYNLLGVCGEGLWCSNSDNRCHGCFIPSMDCFPE